MSGEDVVEPTALFESFDGSGPGWCYRFDNPAQIYVARTTKEVVNAIRLVERETAAGRWVALMLAYEAAPAFDNTLAVHTATDFPLAWVAVFDHPSTERVIPLSPDITCSEWRSAVPKTAYAESIRRIRAYIEAGDTYQVNYTFPLTAQFEGDALGWFQELGRAQGAGYCVYLDLGEKKILSLSPELFFEREGDKLRTRPMKGTMPRGRWLEEDEAMKQALAASEKNRAENLMIVDLLRNDLGKISKAGSVRVSSLFQVERYRTVHQMTSTIESIAKPGVGLWEVLQALFPCGSVTGAPKIRTMGIIRELEPHPRRAYTGAIGLVKPGGDCVFNVAIRTVVLDTDTGEAIANVGGGITYDSTPEGEYEECLTKAKFLSDRPIEFELLETMLLEDGAGFLLERHLSRMKSSANYFGFRFDEGEIRERLARTQKEYSQGNWKIRLLLSRDGVVVSEVNEAKSDDNKIWRVRFAKEPINKNDIFLYHKTTNRSVYEKAKASATDGDDAILWNEAEEVTESSIANIVMEDSGILYTPPRESGLLAGKFRDELIATGQLKERVITKEQLRRAGKFFLINSVRKWIPAALVE